MRKSQKTTSWTSALRPCRPTSRALAQQDDSCHRLMTVPGVGGIHSVGKADL
jgi:hypothetical protein